jgi:hypothetical protein
MQQASVVSPLGQNFNIAKLSSGWQVNLNLSCVSSLITVPIPAWPTNRKSFFSKCCPIKLTETYKDPVWKTTSIDFVKGR